jgi:nickel transport protein
MLVGRIGVLLGTPVKERHPTMNVRLSIALAVVAELTVPNVAATHELIVKPTLMSATAGTQLDFAVLSSHVFITSQELEAQEDIRAGFAFDGKRTEVPVKPDEGSLSYLGSIKSPTNRPFFLTATRLPQIWATTPQGSRPATKKTPGATNAFKIDKFEKTLINAAPGAAGFDASIGDPLEIVLTTNPATARVGDNVGVKVLAAGKPIAATVNATYDGFSKQPDTYAYATHSKADGTAVVKVSRPGLWMVRVQNAVPEVTDLYDRHLTRAVLVFTIK